MEDSMSVVSLARPPRIRPKAIGSWRPAAKLLQLASAARAVITREFHVRRDMRRLAEYDDHMLRDIGIARADIEGAVRRGHDGLGDGTGASRPVNPIPTPTGWR
jgi:uncharacterized protein YjiS (DUF1127 family)